MQFSVHERVCRIPSIIILRRVNRCWNLRRSVAALQITFVDRSRNDENKNIVLNKIFTKKNLKSKNRLDWRYLRRRCWNLRRRCCLQFLFKKKRLIFLPVVQYRDTKTAFECNFRSKNCDIQFWAGIFLNKKSEKKIRIFKDFFQATASKLFKTYQFINRCIEANLIVVIVQLRIFAFVSAERMFWTINAASWTIGAARARIFAL